MRKRFMLLIVLVLVPAILLSGCGKGSDYKDAMSLYENGSYHEASIKFTELGDYENSKEMVKICRYEEAKALMDAGEFEEARKIFADLGDYERSAENVKECDYQVALGLYEAGNLEAALDAFQKISGYNDVDTRIEEIKKELVKQQYGPVFDALKGNTWFFNGGADTILNGISFEEDTASIAQVYFDGNGKHDNGSTDHPYTVDDQNIIVTLTDGSELKIPYVLSDGKVSLGNSDYYSLQEIDAELQGYWNMRNASTILGLKTVTDKNIFIDNGKVISESASLANGSTTGEYYYYGPYQGTYTLNFGGFDTDMSHGNEWFFNIIDGKVTLLNHDHICTPTDKLPGENGYSF